MKHWLTALITCCILASCTCFRPCNLPFMDMDIYASIPCGACIDEAINCAGDPFRIYCCECEPDTYEYVFIERIEIGPDIVEQNHYIFKVSNGIITDKWMEHYDSPIDFTFGRPLP